MNAGISRRKATVTSTGNVVSLPQKAGPRPDDLAEAEQLPVVLRLIDVLDRENAALASGDRNAIPDLALEKRLACRAWEEAAASLAEAAGEGGLDAGRHRTLHAMLHRLDQTSRENQRRLSAMLAAHERVMEIIAAAVRAADPAVKGYARNGAPMRRGPLAVAPRAVSYNCAT